MDTVASQSVNADKRQFPRRPLPTGYAEVRVKRPGRKRYSMAGHAYDISATGMRFELDRPLNYGEQVELLISLPSPVNKSIAAKGVMVRYHDPEEAGPVRMAVMFTEMADPNDRLLIDSYVRAAQRQAA